MISKGESAWSQYEVPEFVGFWLTCVRSATFDHKRQTFYYMDSWNNVVTFSVKNKKFNLNPMKASNGLPYSYVQDTVQSTMYKRKYFNLKDDEYVEVCGLTLHKPVNSRQLVFLNEAVNVLPAKECVQKAVWIQPRFSEADLNQHW